MNRISLRIFTAFMFCVITFALSLSVTACAGTPGNEEDEAQNSSASADSGGRDGAGEAAVSPRMAPTEKASDEAVAETMEKGKPAPRAEGAPAGTRAGVDTGGEALMFVEEDISSSAARDGLSGTRGMSVERAEVSGLSAGYADDNKQYGYFVRFLEEYAGVPHLALPVNERIAFMVSDTAGKPVANARVRVTLGAGIVAGGVTMTDGSFLFFPAAGDGDANYTVTVTSGNWTGSVSVPREGQRRYDVTMDSERQVPEPIPLDILFVMDTTGSMGEEIERLRTTIELIHMNLTSLTAQPRVRFGMVLYKDEGDEYLTRTVPLTADLDEFRRALNLVEASGGGDTPEDLNAALERAIHDIAWDTDGVRLAFIITDAPPHLDYGQEYDYADAARDAKEGGIKFFTVGTGGLDIDGEYILRQISQYTSGKYIFLTYGEQGESEGGAVGSVSHHTGTNFSTDKLEAIIIRFAKEELSYQTDKPLLTEEEYFEARRVAAENKEDTLRKLFAMALSQLVDYSSLGISPDTAVAVLPFDAVDGIPPVDAEYFTEQMLLTAADSLQFRLVERSNLNTVMDELKLQLSGVTDGEGTAELGRILNADILAAGKLYHRSGQYELFLKFLRVETGEVLSVTKALIDEELGLTFRE